MNFVVNTDILAYGDWVEWMDESSASESIRAGRTVHVKHGSQILNIQLGIMRFLASCVYTIKVGRSLGQYFLSHRDSQIKIKHSITQKSSRERLRIDYPPSLTLHVFKPWLLRKKTRLSIMHGHFERIPSTSPAQSKNTESIATSSHSMIMGLRIHTHRAFLFTTKQCVTWLQMHTV